VSFVNTSHDYVNDVGKLRPA